MKAADEPKINYKSIVLQGYDRIAKQYSEIRSRNTLPEIELLEQRLVSGSRLLDLGCGSGVPITKWLAERHKVTGVDFSKEQINLAKANVPSADFICKDIIDVFFRSASFDAIVSLYVIFHLPREEQTILFGRIAEWLSPGGYLFASLSYIDQPSYTEDDFFGVKMYWDSMSLDEYKSILDEVGLEIIEVKEIGHGYSKDSKRESHPIVLARKSTGT